MSASCSAGLDPTGALDAFESLLKAAGKAAEPTEAWRSDTGGFQDSESRVEQVNMFTNQPKEK